MKISFLLMMPVFVSRLFGHQETGLAADFRGESERFQDSCGSFKLIGCAQLLFTDHPLHIAVGSLAPQNGFGSGLALTTHYTPNEHWRLFMNADAVATPNGAWRAGGYLSAVLIRPQKIKVRPGTGGSSGKTSRLTIREMPVFHAYAQGISLNKLPYYGIGQGTSNNASFFGMTQTIAGGNVIWPVFDPLKLSLFGEANGRFFSLRGAGNQQEVSIEQVNNDVSAPGLLRQPSYAQFGQGVQLHPSFLNGYLRLNYAVTLQEWVATDSTYSFRRFKTDLSHQFPLYRTTRSFQPRQFNGPDTCAEDPNSLKCPGISRNLEGSIELRFFYTTSYTSGGGIVPFYLDPTIGGSDLNGTPLLPSLPDYRFRGPNMIAFRIAFEHSIYKWPIGVKLMLDEGKVGFRPSDLDFTHLAHSYAAGLTVRAGGLPVVDLLFAWGGGSTHTTAAVSPSLLGGTARPSLF
jgi:hypothetical protein